MTATTTQTAAEKLTARVTELTAKGMGRGRAERQAYREARDAELAAWRSLDPAR